MEPFYPQRDAGIQAMSKIFSFFRPAIFAKTLLILCLMLGMGRSVTAQCPSPNTFQLQHIASGVAGLTPATLNTPVDANATWAGHYVRVNVISGNKYKFSLVGSEQRLIDQFGSSIHGFPDGLTPNFTFARPEVDHDPMLTLYDNSGSTASNTLTGTVLAFNEDASVTEKLPELEYTATYTGVIYAAIDLQPGTTAFNTGDGTSVTIASALTDCSQLFTDSTSLRVTWIPAAPAMQSATKDSDTQITVTYDDNVLTNGGNPTDFTVTDGVGATYSVSAQADGTAGDTDIVLTVANLSAAVGDLTVTYTNNNNEISDLTGVDKTSTDATGVTIDLDATAPTLVSATLDSDTQITLTFSEAVQTNEGNPTDFTVTDALATDYVVSAQADGTVQDNQIVLTVADMSNAGGDITITYTDNNSEITDFGNNALATDATGVTIDRQSSFSPLSGKITWVFQGGPTGGDANGKFTTQVVSAGLDTLQFPDAGAGNRYGSVSLGDLDNDGDLDFISGNRVGGVHYYENVGTVSEPRFGRRSIATLDTLDFVGQVANETRTALEDIDNDGDLDLFVMPRYDYEGFNFIQDFFFLENTGSASVPKFTFADITGLLVNQSNFPGVDFADLDNDGDKDMIAGGSDSLSYFKNTGTLMAPVFEQQFDLDNPFDQGIGRALTKWKDLSFLAPTPRLEDFDQDGDFDIYFVREDGLVAVIENFGTATTPDFVDSDDEVKGQLLNGFGGDMGIIDVVQFGTIDFGDLNGDGVKDVMLSSFNPTEFFWMKGVSSAPTLVSAVKDSDTQITVTLNEPVQTNGGNPTDFAVTDGLANNFMVSAQADGIGGDTDILLTVADMSTAVGDLTITYNNNNDEINSILSGAALATNATGVVIDLDTSAPTLVSASLDSDTQITLTLSEPVQTNGNNPTDFTIVDANSSPFVVSAQVDGTALDTDIVLTVADLSSATGPLTITYANNNNEITDFGGNSLATDATGIDLPLLPVMLSAVLDNNTQITVTYDVNVRTNGGNPSDFTVTDGVGTTFAVTGQADGTAGDTDIVLTVADLSSAVGDLTVTYTNNNNEISDDDSGATFAETDATGVTIDTDVTAPTLSAATKDSDTQITVTFSEPVQTNGTNPTDFTMTDGQGTAFTVTAQADDTAKDTDIVLTVNDMSGAVGDLTVTYTNNNNEISDFGGNDLATDATGITIDLDSTVPTVSSIVRQDPTAERTNKSTVIFRVTFSELVDNVDVTDFSISGAGAGGTAAITGITTETANTVFDVTVGTIDTEGELDLDFDAGQDISDFGGNAFAGTISTEETYTIDLTQPTITSITRNSPDSEITNANSVVFRVTLSEEVTNAGTKDFELSGDAGGGTAVVSAVSTQELSTEIDVTVSNINTEGELNLDIFVFHSLGDVAGNFFAGTISSEETYTIDMTAPTLMSATKDSDTQITVSLDEVVQTNGTNPTDFTVTDGLGNSYAVSTQADGTADDADIVLTVADLSGAIGDLKVTYANNNGEISDLAGNDLDTDATGVSIDTDATSPTLVSGTRDSDTQLTITFSEAVQIIGDNPDDFTVQDANNTPFAVTQIADGTAQDDKIILTVADFSTATGPLTVIYQVDCSDISDFGGNALQDDLTGIEVALNPTVTAVSVPANDTYTAGEDLNFQVTFNPAVTITGTPQIPVTIGSSTVNATLSGTVTNATTATFTYTVQSGEEDTDGIEVGATIDLNGATIQDTNALDAILTLNNVASAEAVLVDAIAPAAPVIVSITDDTGSSDSDKITNDQTLVVKGTAEANSSVSLLVNGEGPFGGVTLTTDGDGNWEFDPVGEGTFTLDEGEHTYTATTEDAAGNVSEVSDDFVVTVDLTAPVAPTLDLVASTDLGISDSDDLTSGGTLTFEGTAEPGTSVLVGIPGLGPAGDAVTADIDGNWTLTVNDEIPSATYGFVAVSTDIAGNESESSTALDVEVDQDLAISTLSPADDETDVLPNANLTITFDKNVVKGTGNISIKQVSDDAVIETIDVTGSNVTVSGAEVTIDPVDNILPPDTEFYVNIDAGAFENEAGAAFSGISDKTTWSFTIIAASTVSSVSVPSDGMYKIGDDLDFTVNMVLPVTVTGTPTIPVTIGSQTVNASLVGTATDASALTFRYTVVEGDLDADGIAIGSAMDLNGGTMKDEFDVDAILGLNNVAATSGVLVDGVVPTAPVIVSITDDTGTSNSDQITNDQTLLVNGTAEANSTLSLLVDGVGPFGGITIIVDGDGNWEFDPVGEGTFTLDEGVHTYTATTTDAAGNVSEVSADFDVTVDLTAPAAPAVDLVASSDSGTSDTDDITNDITPTVQGVSEANAPIEILVDGSSVGNTTADDSGDWSFTITTDWADGVYDVTVKATDIAGNTSEAGSALSLTIDTTVPTNVFFPPIEEDDIINNSEKTDVVVTGGTSGVTDGLEVAIRFTDGVNTPIEITTAVMADVWATEEVDISSLADGAIQVTANVADAAGNNAETILADLVLDTTAPEAPVVSSITEDSGNVSDDELTNDQTLSFIGTAEANGSVEVFIDGTSIGTTTADGAGDWTYDHTGTTLADANYSITAKTTDEAGNLSPESMSLDITVDTTAPPAPVLDLVASTDLGISDSDNLTSGGTLIIQGTAEPGTSVLVGIPDLGPAGEAVTTDIDGNWSLTLDEEIPSGTYDFIAIATDLAGNESSESDALSITVDQDLAISTTSPTDGEIDVLPNANLTITFDKNVVKGTGNIQIIQSSNDAVQQTIDVAGSNVTVSGATVTIDPAANILPPDTEFYVNIDEGAFQNEAGAPFAGISDNATWSFTIIAASVVSSVDVPADGTYMIGDNLDFTVNMILPVSISGTATIPVTIGSTTVNATQVGTISNSNSILFRYTVVEDELDADGIVVGSTIDLNGGTMQDEFGVDAILTLNGVASTTAVLVDGVKPTPVITSTAVDLVNGTFSATITYNEAVENFTVADLTVTNGTAANLVNTVTGTTWTVDITPTADGTVTVTLPVATANDLAGNESNASNSISRDFDGTAPEVISVNRTDADPLTTGTTEASFRVTFSEEVTGVDLTDLEVVLTASATGVLNSITPVDGSTYDVNINGIGGQGTIGLNVKDDDTIIDAATNPLSAAFTGQVYTTNFIPTDIGLSVSAIDENNNLTEVLAAISTTDADAGDSHTYTLVAGTGDTDNASFTIDGTNLRANSISFNFEDRDNYSLRLRTDDGKGGIYEEAFTCTINDVNEVPSMLSLSNISIDEDDNAQDVGMLATLDQDGGETFTYSLVSGTGDTDNAEFEINGNTLRTAGLINFEDGASRSILVRVTDSGGLTLDQQFTINIGEVVIEPLREYEANIPGGAVRNIFSPNGDGVNETWVIEDLLDNPVNEVKVYAQGGKLIFSQVNYQNDWDGTFKGDPIPDGTYYYEINVYDGERIIKGFLTIIRNR
ncbi:MAG: T9SS type B sorting domain-containing protein [Roseivirga sp.]|nr:T9SS type B sorting domain-containing protein [Roseivirga sp.]